MPDRANTGVPLTQTATGGPPNWVLVGFLSLRDRSTGVPAQYTEKCFDVCVRANIQVTVEVGSTGARERWADSTQTTEERLDIQVGADVVVTVEVRGPTVIVEGQIVAV